MDQEKNTTHLPPNGQDPERARKLTQLFTAIESVRSQIAELVDAETDKQFGELLMKDFWELERIQTKIKEKLDQA